MDVVGPVTDTVKDVAPIVKRYFKYQICHNVSVNEFKEMQTKLERRRLDVAEGLRTQLMPGKIAKQEVQAWLDAAEQETAENVVEDLICKGGCLTYICSSRKLDKRTQSLNEGIFKEGEKYTNAGESLVIDDHSIEYCTKVFKEKQERVKHQKEHIEANLKTQCMQPGKIARKEVEAWLEKAGQQVAIKVEDLISQEECSSSTNLIIKNIEELKQMLEEGKEFTYAGVSLVIDDHSIKGVPVPIEECRGRDYIQDQILEWLKGDEVTRIAVWGMGGVGKTTIMKQVHNQLLKESKFNKVIWVTVSEKDKKKFDILEFQKTIASSLKLELEDHVNETKHAGLISQKLGQGSFLLILDDVWQPFSLEDVGIPDIVGNNGCKLVLTTRLQHIARDMNCKVVVVDPLPANEASALFLKKVGSDVLSYGKIKRDIEPFFKQILQKCGGVPLAIVAVAKSMRGKSLPRHWKLALSEFSKFESIVDCLKFSYECLEPQCQECFLYCALYLEDYGISKEELIEYWIEEGLIYKEGKTREAMNWKGHDILDKLVDNCLLELVSGNNNCVSMHDLFREMALDIRPQFLVKAGIALNKLPEEDEWSEGLLKVSLMKNHKTEIPSSMPSPKCPMLTTLLLSDNKISTIPEAFFEHMLGLKILDLSNNRELSRLPTSVSKLEKLTTLLLKYCGSLREVPSLSNLVCLKKLDLLGTSIEELPQGLNMLTNLKHLCLGGRLSGILAERLQNLSKLQHLLVASKTKFKCEKIGSLGKLQNLEYLVLCDLDNLDAVFGEIGAVAKSAPLPVGTFSSLQYIGVWSCDKIKKLFSVRWLEYLQKLQTINVGACEQLEEIIGSESEEGEKVTLPKLESLTLTLLPQLKSIYSGSGSLVCDSINKIYIDHCKNIESVFWSGFNPLPNLEYLELSSLENLKCVFDGEALGLSPLVPLTSFFSLKEAKVFGCHQLKKVFSSGWLLRYFQSLEYIEVNYCSQMEELISSSAHEEEKVTLSKLECLRLMSLPQLKSIYSDSNTILICDSINRIEMGACGTIESIFGSGFSQLPNLEYLELSCLDNLKCLFDEEGLGLSPLVPPTNFVSLKEIRVYKCYQLKKVFSSGWLLRYFQSLETISVGTCLQLEELISSSAHEEEKVTLPNLQSLKLIDLPALKSICCGSNVLICDSIQSLSISECKMLKRIPLNFPQTSHPPSLKEIVVFPKEWWESLEWDHPNAKDILLPFCEFQKINWPW